jgi:hypothetical protein
MNGGPDALPDIDGLLSNTVRNADPSSAAALPSDVHALPTTPRVP